MGRLIPGPYSTNKNLTGTCAENLTDTFSYSKRAGSGNSPSLSPAAVCCGRSRSHAALRNAPPHPRRARRVVFSR